MEPTSPPSAEAVVVMDRFVSASSAQDAITSLEQIVGAFKNSNDADRNEKENEIIWQPAWIFEHEEIVEHFIWLLQHGTLKANESPCEEGIHLICQLYQQLLKSSEALTKPSPGKLLESLLDILDNFERPVYVRVLALELLEELSKRHKSIAVNQWLQAPNGLYRIVDILAIDIENNPMEEAIRNQALIVAKSLAREAPMAKIFLFAEVDSKLLDLCWKEGGLTKGSPIVIDALELIEEVLKHADKSLQDLMWQRPNIAPRLIQLLDLRGGEEFLHPAQKSTSSANNSHTDDDLDSILASGDGKSKDTENTPIPHLLPSEEIVVKLVLNILRLLLETDSVRETIWRQQTSLCSIVWELALVSNPSSPPVCALPTPSLQQEALNLVADKFNDPVTMDRLSGLDRLLYLVCTGGGISDTFNDKLGTSQSALAVLRQSLSGDRIHDTLMRTLAPPPTEDENSEPKGPTVVQKLWNTVQENLTADISEERTLFLSGALGGLGLMLFDEQSREIMFKVTPISLDEISERLTAENESFVKCSLLRFLCEWIYECPFIVHNLLSSTASTNLAGMSASPSDYQSLTHLLLGLAMEYLTKEEECGGWTRNGILQIIMKIGISKYTSSLEGLKTTPNKKMPWVVSEMEMKNWRKFCRKAVLTVRKRVVEELAAGSGDSDDESDDRDTSSGSDGPRPPSSQGVKPFRRLVSQQAKEIEEMAIRLEASEAKVASQEDQLNTWKRRIECTPTELDHMLNDFTSKNSDLEDKVRLLVLENERYKSEKEKGIKLMEAKLSDSEVEADRLRSKEKEIRDDLERTEQEMKALSQAYTSLEEEYQKQQNEVDAIAMSDKTLHGQKDKSFEEQNGTGSTEITTLRTENARLKNDARKADEWMSMAVQKMNEIGTTNSDLRKQVTLLNEKIEESHAAADKFCLENQSGAHQRERLEAELENEKELRLAAEESLPNYDNLRSKLELEVQRSEDLEHRIIETEQQLCKYKNMELKLQAEQERLKELETRVFEAEEDARVTATHLKSETEAKIELERQINIIKKSNEQSLVSEIADDNEKVQKLRAEHQKILATKNTEIDALRLSLEKYEKKVDNAISSIDTKDLVSSSEIVEEIRKNSEEEIYRLESVIRELKDRLDSDLGAYTIEDIFARDEDIEELRKANESAQEWMGKAVEHHNRHSNQIQKLSDENAFLLVQLEEERKKQIHENTTHSPSLKDKEFEKLEESDLLKTKIASLEVELEALKQKKEADQGLLDELGIAMDDVAVMQQQLLEYKLIKSELERKLDGNVLSVENNDLRVANEDLQTRLNEFEEWVQVAQTKIGDINSAKDEIEMKFKEVTENARCLKKDNDALKSKNTELVDEIGVFEELRKNIKELESKIDFLKEEKSNNEHQYENLQSEHETLLESFNNVEQQLSAVVAQKNTLEKDLAEQKRLSSTQSDEIGKLKIAKKAFLDSPAQSQARIDGDKVITAVNEKYTATDLVESADIPKAQCEEVGATQEEDEFVTINDLFDELQRTKTELVAVKEALSSNEGITHEWEERATQLESELANLHQQMQEQENEAVNAISKWQQNVIDLEEKCAEHEEDLKKALDSKDQTDALDCENAKLKNENAILLEKIDGMQASLIENSDDQIKPERQHGESIVKLREALNDAQNTRVKDKSVIQRCEERISELEMKIESLETKLRESQVEANEMNIHWQDECAIAKQRCASIEEELNQLKTAKQSNHLCARENDTDEANISEMMDIEQKEGELRRLNEEVDSSNDSLQKHRDELVAQKREIEFMSEDLGEARKQIERWEGISSAQEEEISQLKNDIEKTKAERNKLQDLHSKLSNDNQMDFQWGERTKKLSESIAILEEQLKEQEQEALDAVEQWQSACSDLETKCANLELIVKDSHETISTRGWSIEQLTSCNENYRAEIENLEATSRVNESSLRGDLARAEAEIKRLIKVQEVERKKWIDDQSKFQTELEVEKQRNGEAKNRIATLSNSLHEIKTDSDDALNKWTVRHEELYTALTDVREQLEEQENEANEAISSWELKTDELEKELDVAEDQLLRLQEIFTVKLEGTGMSLVVAAENLLRENTDLNSEKENLTKIVGENTSQMRLLESENKALEDLLSTKEEQFQDINLKRNYLENQLSLKSEDKLEEERDRLIGIVAQLEEELREANSTLQACVTDGSIDKASEFAANAIRDDIYNLRNQLNEYQERFEDEKAAKDVAELEIQGLRDDIAALLSLSDHEKSPVNMKKLTTKSIEKLQKLEHSEIEDLRKSLFRALEELEFTRSSERETNETISKLRLQISIYEQEVTAAKSEINFLIEAMEESRQTEGSKRASLEYRIGSLENENELVRKYQANELESLRNELVQITMEKDMVINQLKEIEKINASLVLAASKEGFGNTYQNSDIHSECVKLRIENAHLITTAAEDKGKAERRLREMLSAQVASSELDVILEHELRLSAETALNTLKEEFSELQNGKQFDQIQKTSDGSMEQEIRELRSSFNNLKEQHAKLKVTMDEEASKSKEMIDRLTEECRQAQAKAFKFDRDSRTEIAVQSEITRMKLSTMSSSGDQTSSHEDLITSRHGDQSTSNCETAFPSAEAFELIRKQQKEIQEERMMYSETLQEHENLLALVAQQDLEKSCLREALIEVAGDDVANDAIKRAEEFAVMRYGNAVQVSY